MKERCQLLCRVNNWEGHKGERPWGYGPCSLSFLKKIIYFTLGAYYIWRVSPLPLQLSPVCDAPLPESTCSRCSTPTYEWEHMVLGFLFLGQFAENDGFHIHLSPYKGHELIIFYGCIVFHGVYVPHFLCLVYHWWAFGLVPGLCYYTQGCSEYTCACVFIAERFIVLWIYTQ